MLNHAQKTELLEEACSAFEDLLKQKRQGQVSESITFTEEELAAIPNFEWVIAAHEFITGELIVCPTEKGEWIADRRALINVGIEPLD